MAGFFDGNTETPESARKRRAVAEAMMNQGAPKDVGSGMAALGNALMQRQQQRGPFPDSPAGSPAPGVAAKISNFLGLNRGGLY